MSYISCFLLSTLAIGAIAQDIAGYQTVQGNCRGEPLKGTKPESVPSADACASLCNARSDCQGFSFSKRPDHDGHMCVLKDHSCSSQEADAQSPFTYHGKMTKQAFLGGFLPDPWYAPGPAYPVPPPAYYYGSIPGFTRANGNCQGNFLTGVLALPLEQCASQCLGTPGCAGLSFNFNSAYPQCILKAATCPFPDPGAVFTFFARNGFPAPPPPSYYPPYYPDVYVPEPYPAYPIYTPWVKSANKFKESAVSCLSSGILSTQDLDLTKCAEACLSTSACKGFSFDNFAKSSPYTCTLRSEPCQVTSNSSNNRWSYFERQSTSGNGESYDVDTEYLNAIEAGAMQEKKKEAASFFDMQKFFSQRAPAVQAVDQIKRR